MGDRYANYLSINVPEYNKEQSVHASERFISSPWDGAEERSTLAEKLYKRKPFELGWEVKKKKGSLAPGCCFWMVSSKLFSSHSYCSPPDYPSCEILYHLMWMLLGTWHLLICFIQLLPGHPALYLLCKFCLGTTTSSPSCKIIEVLPTSYSSLLENTHWALSKYFLASKLEWTFPENTDGFQVWSI